MKAIMISGLPRWTALIANGDKTFEIRSSEALYKAIQKLIDKYGYADIYWYCSKNGGWLTRYKENNGTKYCWYNKENDNLNGKVIFKFRCYKVEELTDTAFGYETITLNEEQLYKQACLNNDEWCKYLKYGRKKGYAIHISDLEIFNRPKELSEFYHYVKYNEKQAEENKQDWDFVKLIKAPQNFCYVEVEE